MAARRCVLRCVAMRRDCQEGFRSLRPIKVVKLLQAVSLILLPLNPLSPPAPPLSLCKRGPHKHITSVQVGHHIFKQTGFMQRTSPVVLFSMFSHHRAEYGHLIPRQKCHKSRLRAVNEYSIHRHVSPAYWKRTWSK